MSSEVLHLNRQGLRGSDSNSLLRLYDRANGLLSQARSPRERERADKAVRQIAEELRRRDVPT